jgi:glycosyltransferase involved in cell wall biosynthesis
MTPSTMLVGSGDSRRSPRVDDDAAIPWGKPRLHDQRKICLVTGEIAGPDFNGGIGTANWGLALALRAAGFPVHVLYTRVEHGVPFCFRGEFSDQVIAFANRGIHLMSICHMGKWNDWPAKSFYVLEHLKEAAYDVVFFNDTHGTGYYSLLARRTGSSDLLNTMMCVVAHSATQWIQQINGSPIASVEDLKLMEMERRSLELADFVIAPSQYILKKYRDYGWSLPQNTVVMQNILPQDHRQPLPINLDTVAIDELVFFGRLESRKGLWLFCNALDRMKYQLRGRAVTFLGKPTEEGGESTAFGIVRRSAAWPFEVRLLFNYDRDQALSYLKGGQRLAVMPSPEDNSPCVIIECVERRIPFIASAGSGGEELLSEEARRRCLCLPTVAALCEKLSETLEAGASTAALSFDPDENERAVIRWLGDVIARPATATTALQPQASGHHSEKLILLALMPGNVDTGKAASQVALVTGLFGNSAELVVLTAKAVELSEIFGDNGPPERARFIRMSDYASFVDALTADQNSSLAIFHIMAPITPEWLARARLCLACDLGIDAVAGLAASEDTASVSAMPPYVTIPSIRRIVRQHRLGAAPALLALSQETNSGFALLGKRALAVLLSKSPIDVQYGRLKPVADWVDELFVELSSHGMRFETIPDYPLDFAPREESFEVYRRGSFVRSLVASQLGFAPGSHQALLARLGIETTLDDDRQASTASCLSYLAGKLGAVPQAWSTADVGSDDTIRTLAKMAYASGQIGLAEDLVSELVAADARPSSPGPMTLAALARLQACDVRLIELLTQGKFQPTNLNHEWSFKILEDERAFELHPNPANEGTATIMFPSVDLRDVARFHSTISVANGTARRVRFRVDIIARAKSAHFRFEQVADPMETALFEFSVPVEARAVCDVVLATEMALHFDPTEHAWARWYDSKFESQQPELGNASKHPAVRRAAPGVVDARPAVGRSRGEARLDAGK